MVLLFLGALLSFWLAPRQEINSQHALDQEEAKRDAQLPFMEVLNAQYNPIGGTSYVFAGPIGSDLGSRIVRPGREHPGLAAAIDSAGGIGVYGAHSDRIRITVRSVRTRSVLITRVRAHIFSRGRPPRGGIIYNPPQGASDPLQIAFDLGSTDLEARHFTEVGAPTQKHYLSDTQLTIEPGETLSFDVVGYSLSEYYEWGVVFETSQHEDIEVLNGGRPWRTTALASSYRTAYAIDFTTGDYRSCVWPNCDT